MRSATTLRADFRSGPDWTTSGEFRPRRTASAGVTITVMVRDLPPDVPASLSLDEAYRAAFYLVLAYVRLEKQPPDDLINLMQYMWSDPARWHDWLDAVSRAVSDGGLADPDHEGRWQVRPEMPS